MTQNFNQRTDDLKSIKNHQLMKSGDLVDKIMNKREKKEINGQEILLCERQAWELTFDSG